MYEKNYPSVIDMTRDNRSDYAENSTSTRIHANRQKTSHHDISINSARSRGSKSSRRSNTTKKSRSSSESSSNSIRSNKKYYNAGVSKKRYDSSSKEINNRPRRESVGKKSVSKILTQSSASQINSGSVSQINMVNQPLEEIKSTQPVNHPPTNKNRESSLPPSERSQQTSNISEPEPDIANFQPPTGFTDDTTPVNSTEKTPMNMNQIQYYIKDQSSSATDKDHMVYSSYNDSSNSHNQRHRTSSHSLDREDTDLMIATSVMLPKSADPRKRTSLQVHDSIISRSNVPSRQMLHQDNQQMERDQKEINNLRSVSDNFTNRYQSVRGGDIRNVIIPTVSGSKNLLEHNGSKIRSASGGSSSSKSAGKQSSPSSQKRFSYVETSQGSGDNNASSKKPSMKKYESTSTAQYDDKYRLKPTSKNKQNNALQTTSSPDFSEIDFHNSTENNIAMTQSQYSSLPKKSSSNNKKSSSNSNHKRRDSSSSSKRQISNNSPSPIHRPQTTGKIVKSSHENLPNLTNKGQPSSAQQNRAKYGKKSPSSQLGKHSIDSVVRPSISSTAHTRVGSGGLVTTENINNSSLGPGNSATWFADAENWANHTIGKASRPKSSQGVNDSRTRRYKAVGDKAKL